MLFQKRQQNATKDVQIGVQWNVGEVFGEDTLTSDAVDCGS